MNTYTCSNCGETFESGWSEEEAIAEKEQNFPGHDLASCDVICDDCYQRFMKWWNAPPIHPVDAIKQLGYKLTPEQEAAMRAECDRTD